MMMKRNRKRLCSLLVYTAASLTSWGQLHPASTAGFYEIPDGNREVYNFNVGWRFHKGSIDGGAQAVDFNDSAWPVVNTPHGLEYLPEDASGSINYQGEAWYRKHFTLPASMRNRRVVLHFEAIMGKSQIWVNGVLVKKQFGGFLPIVMDVTDFVKVEQENVVAVLADNSNDPSYPPGKPQETMDFSYFGGIYRDVWLYSTAPVYITDPNQADTVAGGGVFVHYENLTDDAVDVVVSTQIKNATEKSRTIELSSTVLNAEGKTVGEKTERVTVHPGKSVEVASTIRVLRPHLWQPDDPYLHRLVSRVRSSGQTIDGLATQIGIRTIEFRGKDGFFLNNRAFGEKLIGANRHQDFAYIGNALPNSLHWRDVKKLRNAGMRIIRSAHYPQDPAFMDACDELGMFVIVATPGWQFWNDDPIFGERVYSDIRQMVRRDRNHPSVILWEPILNETHYPADFAKKAHDTVHAEYPFQGCFTACDERAKDGKEHYDVLYGGPSDTHDKSVFTREWGDNVDDWSSHNSPSRVHRAWGEEPMLVQAQRYADPRPVYSFGSLERLHGEPTQLTGGCLWHSFDHYRGYHPDNFYGGIMDTFRQPKYAYTLFQSQRDPKLNVPQIENGPMIYIANEMTPFSRGDVKVFTNCDEVRLIVFGEEFGRINVAELDAAMPSPIVEFKDVYHFMDIKKLHRAKQFDQACLVAEGLIDGEVVATHTRYPAKRPHRLELSVDLDGRSLLADGSDLVVVIASLVDQDGNVKRLGRENILFEVVGEGRLVGSADIGANPRPLEWGTAPCLIQSTETSGKITVSARVVFGGINTPLAGVVTFESIPPQYRLLYSEVGQSLETNGTPGRQTGRGAKEVNLDKVGAQQSEFEHL